MELATRRSLLRDFNDADLAAFETYHNDPRSQEFYGDEHTRPEHAGELIALFKEWAKAQPRLNYQLAIIQRLDPYELIGCCGIRCEGAEPGTAELGIELAPQYWGRYGYAIEVIRTLLEFGFETLALHTVYGGTVSANSRIGRLVSAFGATAVIRPSPAWMVSRGWTQVKWRISRQQWLSGDLVRTGRRAKTRV